VRDTGQWEGFDNSFQIDVRTAMERIVPDVDRHLDTMGRENPGYIRGLQSQSGQLPNYQGPNEDRAPVVPTQPGKAGFGDITPQVEAQQALRAAETEFRECVADTDNLVSTCMRDFEAAKEAATGRGQ
jgi:hypothetical protein